MHNSKIPMFWRRIRQRNCLIGSKCDNCDSVFYPPKLRCMKCGGNSFSEFKFKGLGKIVSFSEIHFPPYGFEKKIPYTIAIIKLEEGPMLTAEVVDYDKLEIGTQVEACLRNLFTNNNSGVIKYNTKFKPIR